jgi:hypothetical protein
MRAYIVQPPNTKEKPKRGKRLPSLERPMPETGDIERSWWRRFFGVGEINLQRRPVWIPVVKIESKPTGK